MNDQVFGKFRLVDEIGRGGCGRVFRARQEDLGRWVAIKVIDAPDAESRARFVREAQLAARLDHPNIVRVYETGEADGHPYIAMEYVPDGRTIDRARLSLREAVTALSQASRAVAVAHKAGIIHRDLKPSNILVGPDGRGLVGDFGLAREIRSERLTRTGTVLGTPEYMPPEQAQGRSLTPRSDVYSLGAILYQLLAGRPPFTGATPLNVCMKVVNDEPLPPGGPDAELAAVALKAMEKEPALRYESANAFADELDRWLAGEHVAARPPGLGRRAKRALRRRGPAIAAALFAGLAVAAWPVVRWQQREADAARARAAEEQSKRDALERERRLAERIAPYTDLVRDTRAFFYGNVDISDKLARIEEELANLEQLIANERTVDGWLTLGMGRYVAGDARRAHQAFERAVEIAPDHPLAHLYLARLFLERSLEVRFNLGSAPGDATPWSDLAARHFDRATGRAGADELDRHVAGALAALARRDDAEVERACAEGLARFGRRAGTEEYWVLLGTVRGGAARVEAFQKAIEIRPHYPWAYFLLGHAWAAGERPDTAKAIETLSHAIRLNPRLALAWHNRAVVRLPSDPAAAIQDFDRAIDLKPDFAESYFSRAGARMMTGDADGAYEDYERALALRPRFAEALFGRGGLRMARQDFAGAIDDFSRSLEIVPGYARAWSWRSWARRLGGDPRGALTDADEAVRLDGKSAEALVHRAEAKEALQDWPGAAADYDAAIAIEPTHGAWFMKRGFAREKAGDLETDPAKARAAWSAALADLELCRSKAPASERREIDVRIGALQRKLNP